MIIAIFPNIKKKQSEDLARSIAQFLKEQGVDVVTEDDKAESFGIKPLSKISPKDVNFIISLGGDGTILRLIHRHIDLQAPILAINLGSLGFMADIPINAIYPSLHKLLDGQYSLQTRMVIEGHLEKESNFAVNDIVIHRAKNPSIIDLAIYVDDCYLNTFSADGIIVSTPNGSTAYSLAAGGPIVTPELNAFILTPINPHTISNRPIVLPPESRIHIEYISDQEAVEISYDGLPTTDMSHGQSLEIGRSSRLFTLVAMPEHDYFATLRSKLGWTGKLRSNLF